MTGLFVRYTYNVTVSNQKHRYKLQLNNYQILLYKLCLIYYTIGLVIFRLFSSYLSTSVCYFKRGGNEEIFLPIPRKITG